MWHDGGCENGSGKGRVQRQDFLFLLDRLQVLFSRESGEICQRRNDRTSGPSLAKRIAGRMEKPADAARFLNFVSTWWCGYLLDFCG